MFRKNTLSLRFFTFVSICFVSIHISDAQVAKTAPVATTAAKPVVKPVPKVVAKPGSVKGTIAADIDCIVKINGSPKPINVKALIPVPTVLNVGENIVEAVSTADSKTTFKSIVIGELGVASVIEISFFDDSKFLDYVKQGNVKMVETAIKKNPDLATNKGDILTISPLLMAIQNSQPEVVKLLVDNGASYTTPTNIYPLHKAIFFASAIAPKGKDKVAPDKELVDYFLSKGCKVTDKDDGGNTPLHAAVRAQKLDMAIYLIQKGAEVNAKNDFDETPMKIADDKGSVSIITLLSSVGGVEK